MADYFSAKHSGNYTYVANDKYTATVTKFTGTERKVTIAQTLDGVSVTAIGKHAFSERANMVFVRIPEGISAIGANPFLDCKNLKIITLSPKHPRFATIDGVLFDKQEKRLICYPCGFSQSAYAIPAGIQRIGEYAFAGSGLASIIIPESVTEIGEFAFSRCVHLTSAVIPDSVCAIGNRAFADCVLLASIVIPESVTSIGEYAFCGCRSLAEVAIPESVSVMDTGVFYGCQNLSHVSIPQSVSTIESRAFAGCKNLSSITIPESVTSIGYEAFGSCQSLTCVSIPESVTDIGDRAFAGCENLVLQVMPDSTAEKYAIDNDILYAYPEADPCWLNG